jgi:hypothetical protein
MFKHRSLAEIGQEWLDRAEARIPAYSEVMRRYFARPNTMQTALEPFDFDAEVDKETTRQMGKARQRRKNVNAGRMSGKARLTATAARDAAIAAIYKALPKPKQWGAPGLIERQFARDGWRINAGKPLTARTILNIIKKSETNASPK